MNKKLLKASYTVEASYLFIIIFMSIFIFISFLYREYNKVNLSFIAHYNAVAMANINDIFEYKKDKIENDFEKMLNTNLIIGKINKSLEDSLLFARIGLSMDREIIDISISKYRPIFFMRLVSIFDENKEEDIKSEY